MVWRKIFFFYINFHIFYEHKYQFYLVFYFVCLFKTSHFIAFHQMETLLAVSYFWQFAYLCWDMIFFFPWKNVNKCCCYILTPYLYDISDLCVSSIQMEKRWSLKLTFTTADYICTAIFKNRYFLEFKVLYDLSFFTSDHLSHHILTMFYHHFV